MCYCHTVSETRIAHSRMYLAVKTYRMIGAGMVKQSGAPVNVKDCNA